MERNPAPRERCAGQCRAVSIAGRRRAPRDGLPHRATRSSRGPRRERTPVLCVTENRRDAVLSTDCGPQANPGSSKPAGRPASEGSCGQGTRAAWGARGAVRWFEARPGSRLPFPDSLQANRASATSCPTALAGALRAGSYKPPKPRFSHAQLPLSGAAAARGSRVTDRRRRPPCSRAEWRLPQMLRPGGVRSLLPGGEGGGALSSASPRGAPYFLSQGPSLTAPAAPKPQFCPLHL